MFSCAEKGKVGTVSKEDPKDMRAIPEIKKVEFGAGWKSFMWSGLPKVKKRATLRIQVELKNTSNKEVKISHKLSG